MESTNKEQTFHGLIRELTSGEPIDSPPWDLSRQEVIELISREGQIISIDEETWWYFLEVLPPRWMSGSAFVFCEGYDRFRLFWQRGDRYFARQLSEAETVQFCQLGRVSRDS